MFVCKLVLLDVLGESDRRLAEQEVRLLRGLDHRNIVKFHDSIGLSGGSVIGLVMQYCEGGDLRHVIRNQAREGRYFAESLVMAWFSQIARGLRYIHGQRILHRDLKTSNIFLKGCPPYECLIGDFGISRVLESTLGSANTVIGTPFYLSPEVCKKEPYSFKSDIWSLGVCLYEMGMLRMAFESGNLLTLVNKIIHEDFEPLDEVAFSGNFCRLVTELLSKNPEERPSAAEILRHEYVMRFIMEEEDRSSFHKTFPASVKAPTLLRLKRPNTSCIVPESGIAYSSASSSAGPGGMSPGGLLLPGKLQEVEKPNQSKMLPLPPPRIFSFSRR